MGEAAPALFRRWRFVLAAEVLIRNAVVHTVDSALPRAGAVAIQGERISWVGDDRDAGEHADRATEVIDAAGGMVIPGVIDSHNHVRLGADVGAVQLHGATSLQEVHRRIAEWLAEYPEATWVEAEGLSYRVAPRHRLADAVAPSVTGGRPAIAYTYDVHNAVLNGPALTRFGITAATERAPFGVVEHDPTTGEPNGVIGDFAVMGLERAGHAALSAVLPGFSTDRQYARLGDSLDLAIGFGITTVVEPQNSLDDLPLFERAVKDGKARSRLVVALFHPPGTTDQELDAFAEATGRFDDDRLRVGPIKLYIDDVIEMRTAAFFGPYVGEPENIGELFYPPEEFRALIMKLDARGFQTFTHSMGDRAIRTVLDAHQHARTANGPRALRHQLVHVECPHPDDLRRFAELDLVACMQPRHWAPEIAASWRAAVGPEREARSAPFRSLRDAGAVLAFSSDWNVAEMDPLIGIHAALTRANLDGSDAWNAHETVDLATAIEAYTMGGAYANHCEDNRGSITPGKYADLAMLSDDLFSLEPEELLEARVELTMVGGKVVFEAG